MIGDVILSVNGYGENALPADGRLVLIATYNAAFQLLGTNFGGDGSTTLVCRICGRLRHRDCNTPFAWSGFFRHTPN
jgi:microcystin-dependent protein